MSRYCYSFNVHFWDWELVPILFSSRKCFHQGSHASLKVLESTLIFFPKFKALKVLEKRTGAWKSLNFIPQVLGSPSIHYKVKLRDHQILLNSISIGLECILFYLLTNYYMGYKCATVLLRINCTVITEIYIKYCCSTAHALNFHRELVLESAKVIEFQHQKIVGTLFDAINLVTGRTADLLEACCSNPEVCLWKTRFYFKEFWKTRLVDKTGK